MGTFHVGTEYRAMAHNTSFKAKSKLPTLCAMQSHILVNDDLEYELQLNCDLLKPIAVLFF